MHELIMKNAILEDRVRNLEYVVREYLKHNGDGRIADLAYKALGEEKPGLRRLKGKVPRYQQEKG